MTTALTQTSSLYLCVVGCVVKTGLNRPRGHAPISLNKTQKSLFSISSQPVAILGRVCVSSMNDMVSVSSRMLECGATHYSIVFLVPGDAGSDTADAWWQVLQATRLKCVLLAQIVSSESCRVVVRCHCATETEWERSINGGQWT